MAREYFCAYHSYLENMKRLNDAERGRLFTACLEYSMTGVEPDLSGNEGFVWDSIRVQIDRDREKYETLCEKNRENITKRYDRIRPYTNEYECIRPSTKSTKEKDKKIEKDTEIENVKERNSPTESKERKPKDDLDTAVDYFKEHRKKLKKPMTDHAVDLFRKRLEKLAPGDVTKKIELIDYAIVKGWQDVYIPDESGNQTSKTPEPKKTPKPRTFVLTEDGGLKYDDEP